MTGGLDDAASQRQHASDLGDWVEYWPKPSPAEIRAAVLAEREACAKVADDVPTFHGEQRRITATIAAAIRARP